MPKQLECFHCAVGAEVDTAEKGAIVAGMDLISFVFRFWDGFLSDFTVFNAKSTRK
jgi:hypothetical protein